MAQKQNVVTDAEKVNQYMATLVHPLKAEIETVRAIIKSSSSKISERIKWNAPSYYCSSDFVTFNPRNTKQVHLVFHHIAITQVESDLLQGDYKDRRMLYLNDMSEVKKHKKELVRIITQVVELIEN